MLEEKHQITNAPLQTTRRHTLLADSNAIQAIQNQQLHKIILWPAKSRQSLYGRRKN
jgi:hypothetical protein